jgi:radical SAM protein with 4Fe4S-binding SPASM domain
MFELEDVIKQYGYFIGTYPSPYIVYNQCMADSGSSVLISVDGNLGTCEHFIDDHFWSHINNPSKKDFNMLNIWREYESPLPICNDCPIYPSCIRPSHCVEMSKCDECYKEWRIKKHIDGIIKVYEDYKKNMPVVNTLAENIE